MALLLAGQLRAVASNPTARVACSASRCGIALSPLFARRGRFALPPSRKPCSCVGGSCCSAAAERPAPGCWQTAAGSGCQRQLARARRIKEGRPRAEGARARLRPLLIPPRVVGRPAAAAAAQSSRQLRSAFLAGARLRAAQRVERPWATARCVGRLFKRAQAAPGGGSEAEGAPSLLSATELALVSTCSFCL